MSSTNKKLIALLSTMIVVLVVIIILAVQLFSKGSSKPDAYYVSGSVQDNTVQNATTNAATGTTVLGTETTTAGSTTAPQTTTAPTAPAVNTTQAPSADVSAMSSQQILDALLEKDPWSRVACETTCTTDVVSIMGKITTNAVIDFPAVIRKTICDTGFCDPSFGFDGNTCAVLTSLDKQSADISMDERSKVIGEKLKCVLKCRYFEWWIDTLVPRVKNILQPMHHGRKK